MTLLAGPGALLADFGLARSYAAWGAAGAQPEAVSGTLPYMAPEQARGEAPLTPAADQYAVGATLYRLLTGEYPHAYPEGCNRLQVVRENVPVPLRDRGEAVPEALCAVIDCALSWEPQKRFENAAAMRAALAAV